MRKLMLIFGTRPEAIKLAPLIQKLRNTRDFRVTVCVTGQHREMLDQVMEIFQINADYDLDVMSHNQDLNALSSKIMAGLGRVFDKEQPDLVVVHGDTTSSFIAALCAYQKHIHVAHVEAGLRSGDLRSPWPEEGNRILISKLAKFHFCPTVQNKNNLIAEGINQDSIFITGNTVIDALFKITNGLDAKKVNVKFEEIEGLGALSFSKKIILITGHRRENFGKNFVNIFNSIKKLALKYPEVQFVYPIHLNPNVNDPARKILGSRENIFLTGPLDYISFVFLMKASYLVVTDSGGIQEEAPSLGKPVIVLRENTERPEGISSGSSILVGHDQSKIIDTVSELLDNKDKYDAVAEIANPYGDGFASDIICEILRKNW